MNDFAFIIGIVGSFASIYDEYNNDFDFKDAKSLAKGKGESNEVLNSDY